MLHPDRFDCLPDTPVSTKEFNHWFKKFQNFLSVFPLQNLDKVMILTNFLSPTVYKPINEYSMYDNAVSVLKSVYMKSTNEVFAWHLLSICKQQPCESLDEFLQALKALSKDSNFKPVTAEQHENEYISDSFISGLQSNSIRQSLLENNTLDLHTMFNQAQSLKLA